MGHANYSNLSQHFINRLYAKGKLSVREAVESAAAKGEEVHASEGGYDDVGMLSMAFEEIVAYLMLDEDGLRREGFRGEGPSGPFIRQWLDPAPPSKCPRDSTLAGLLAMCRERPEDETQFAITADRFQDLGMEGWAIYVRRLPRMRRVYAAYVVGGEDFRNWDFDWDDPDNEYSLLDSIYHIFTDGWRKRYKDIPLLGSVTH